MPTKPYGATRRQQQQRQHNDRRNAYQKMRTQGGATGRKLAGNNVKQ